MSSQETWPTILVIDDQERVLNLLNIVLTQQGYNVLLADNGADGLDLVLSEQPDVVVLDIMMPEMNGYQVLEKLREHPTTKHTYALFLTAKGSQECRIKGRRYKPDAYLAKPFRNEELLQIIERFLERAEESKQLRQRTQDWAEMTVEIANTIHKYRGFEEE